MQYSGFSDDDDDDDTEADEVYVPTTPPERSDAYWMNYNGNLQMHEAKFLHKLHLLQLSKTQHILKMQPVSGLWELQDAFHKSAKDQRSHYKDTVS